MPRRVIVNVFGRDTPVELDDDGDEGTAGDRQPVEPGPPTDAASIALEEP